MPITDYQLIEGATARWIVEFTSGMGENGDWRDLVRMIEETATYTDPRSGKLHILWSESDPEMRRDQGEVLMESLDIKGIEVETEQYSKGFSEKLPRLRLPVVREAIASHVRGMGQAVEISQSRMVWRVLNEGDTARYGLGYDGQPLFDGDHPGKNSFGQVISQSNLFEGMALNAENLEAVVQAMTTYRTSDGRSVGNRWNTGQAEPSFHLYHGPALGRIARKLATRNELDPNVFAGTFVPKLVDSLEGPFAQHWFVRFLRADRPMAMVDGGATIVPTVGPETEPGRRHNRAEWIARAEWGLAYDKWHTMAMARP